MATIKWSAVGAVKTEASTQLNALANAARAFGVTIGNATGLHRYRDFFLKTKFSSAPSSASPYVNLYLVPATSAGTYLFTSAASAAQMNLFVGSFQVPSSLGPQSSYLPRVVLPPFVCKPLIENRTGKALAATGNVLTSYNYNEASS